MGQVMEFYISFGQSGVIGGFLIIGLLVGLVDRLACRKLLAGDYQEFGLLFLPGLALLQVGGNLVEVTTSAAAAAVFMVLMRQVNVPTYRTMAGSHNLRQS